MIPPMLSASPPPSDDEASLDDSEDVSAGDSSFDITGLSQKLRTVPVAGQPSGVTSTTSTGPAASFVVADLSPVRDEQTTPVVDVPAGSAPADPAGDAGADDWGDFSVASSADAAPVFGGADGQPAGVVGGTSSGAETAQTGETDRGDGVLPLCGARPLGAVVNVLSDESDDDTDLYAGTVPSSGGGSLVPKVGPAESQASDVSALVEETDAVASPVPASRRRSLEAADCDNETPASGKISSDASGTDGDTVKETRSSEPVQVCTEPENEPRSPPVFSDFVTTHSTESDFGAFSGPVEDFGDFTASEDAPENAPTVVLSGLKAETVGSSETSVIPPTPADSDDRRHISDSAEGFSVPDSGVEGVPAATTISALVSDSQGCSEPDDEFGEFGTSSGIAAGVSASDNDCGVSVPSDDFGEFSVTADGLDDLPAPEYRFGDFSEPKADTRDCLKPKDNLEYVSAPNSDIETTPKDARTNLSSSDEDMGDFAAPKDDFGDFAAPPQDGGDPTDSADDFGDFSVPVTSAAGGSPPTGEFADFGTAFSEPAQEEGPSPLVLSDQLADPAADDDDDEFGDFEEYRPPPPKDSASASAEAVAAVLCALFPVSAEEREPAAVALDAGGVWYQLREPENTAALSHRWPGSRANSHLLHALRVDANNVISFGGWGGGRLGPGLDTEPIQPTRASPPLPQQQSQQTPPAQVPPAAFDWDGAGLKNPLESAAGGTALSTDAAVDSLLDLDMFDTNTSAVAAPNTFLSCLERELLSDEGAPGGAPSAAPGALYSRLLQQTSSQSLSEAAAEVVARIPNIDFMQAKVLMFPVTGE